jgi:hypothetical protein
MNKISGIIPSSPRVAAVDIKEAPPVRPGTPSFGRNQGVSSLKDVEAPTTAEKSVSVHRDLMDWRSKDQEKAAVAARMSNAFFMKKEKDSESAPVTETVSASVRLAPAFNVPVKSSPSGFKMDELVGPRPLKEDPVFFEEDEPIDLGMDIEELKLGQPEGLYPKGSFLDRTA